ncbi:MAG: disulfide bond formation protein B [Chthoniobacterales bacterium]
MFRGYWIRFLAWVQIVTVCVILSGSLAFEFLQHEIPCPLCVLQRLSFLLACVGPILILRARDEEIESHKTYDARCFALTMFSALVGSLVSIRHILLHIIPPNPGYGPVVSGMHLYTWALLGFGFLLTTSAAGVMFVVTQPRKISPTLVRYTLYWIMAVAVLLIAATIGLAGFHALMVDDPTRYELLRQLRITR